MIPAFDNPHMISNIVILQMVQRCQYISYPPALYYRPDIISKSWSFLFGGLAAERTLALQTIDQFGMMDDGWDGYGAVQIHAVTCKNCSQFLNSLPDNYPFPELTPNSNGTISMEWESQHGSASLEIGKTRYSFYIKWGSGGDPVLRDGDARAIENDIAKIIV
ncbi:MAG: hypothetical protein ACRERU_08815, partial [Methylococcales bacterium]